MIIDAVTATDRWIVQFADREPLEVILSEVVPRAAILTHYPTGIAAEPAVRRSRPATAREAAELRELIADVLDDPDDRAEALRAALASYGVVPQGGGSSSWAM